MRITDIIRKHQSCLILFFSRLHHKIRFRDHRVRGWPRPYKKRISQTPVRDKERRSLSKTEGDSPSGRQGIGLRWGQQVV